MISDSMHGTDNKPTEENAEPSQMPEDLAKEVEAVNGRVKKLETRWAEVIERLKRLS